MISINATLFVQIINLLILIWILNRLMYRPIRRIMAQRQEDLQSRRQQAEDIAKQTREQHDAFISEMDQGRSQVKKRLEALKAETAAQAKAQIDAAQARAKEKGAALAQEITTQMEAARGEIKSEAEKVARSMAGRILDREVA